MTAASRGSSVIVQVSDDTAVVELITDSDETAYREEVRSLAQFLCLFIIRCLNEPQHPQIILHLLRGEHPDLLHHCLYRNITAGKHKSLQRLV